jgi:REP element-mobilizing transposase RayT
MGHTYSRIITHIIFSTQNRIPYLKRDLRDRLFRYMAGIAHGVNAHDVLVNGVADHVHMLVTLPPAPSVADAVKKVKANSSKWVHEVSLLPPAFACQKGYAAFSVSPSKAETSPFLHPESGGSSQENFISRGISGLPQGTSHRFRQPLPTLNPLKNRPWCLLSRFSSFIFTVHL